MLITKKARTMSAGGIADHDEGPRSLRHDGMKARRRVCVTHISHDGTTSNTRDSILDILLDESMESRVFELGRIGIGIGRTVFPKLDNFITEDKADRQDIFTRVGKWKVKVNVGVNIVSFNAFIAFLLPC